MQRTIIAVSFLLLVAGAAAGLWLWKDMQQQLHAPLNLDRTGRITVAPGASLIGIARELEQRGWIDHPYYLAFEGRRRGLAGSIKIGEFDIAPGTTPVELLELLVSGRVVQYGLTLVEGWTASEILAAVSAEPRLVQTLNSHEPEYVMAEIGYAGHFAEGRFYPDTYHFPAGTTDVAFLRRAARTMEAVLAEEWEKRVPGLPYRNPYQALIMASIIEKETAVASERDRIAGVFVRRLERGMKLQTDPTVIYAMGRTFDGNIRRRDLSIDSPFNTYRYPGLPPTPIAAPGRDSIHAALHPADGNELYFVARGDGSHEFSSTLAEHNRAVRKYQLSRD